MPKSLPSPPSLLIRHIASALFLAVLPATALGQEVEYNPSPLANNSALPNIVRGLEAIARLGDQLPVLAQESGMSEAEFRQQILDDEGMWVDVNREVIFVEPYFVAGDGPGSTNQQKSSGPQIPESQAFLLHSRPGSNFTIYLDFDGHRSVNNGWGHDITFPAFNREGGAGSFTSNELREIINHWRYMAEDYALFDVDVTTEEPTLDQLSKSNNFDTTWGVRDIHTQATGGFGNGIGGIAGLFTFSSSLDRPVFSFNKGSNNGGMTGSHEVGHSLGLSHDGLGSSAYHPGSNLGSFSWGPIMGAPFGADVVQWSNGDYANSTATQNDVQIISSSSNGTSVISDDHGNTIGTATPIAGSCPTPNQVEVCAIITSRNDLDAFSFDSNGGSVTIAVGPDDANGIVGNVDILVKLYDPAGVKLVGSNVTRDQSALIIRNIGPGVHTIIVEGGDQANLFSDYGSLGHYILDVTLPGPGNGFSNLGNGLAGSFGVTPSLTGSGFGCVGAQIDLSLTGANPSSNAFLAYSLNRIDLPILGGILVPQTSNNGGIIVQSSDLQGNVSFSSPFPAGIPSGSTLYLQFWVGDPGAPKGFSASNALVLSVP